jgi:hypothetical protein
VISGSEWTIFGVAVVAENPNAPETAAAEIAQWFSGNDIVG